ncbi:hypothetical protein OF83DRAFT_86841 [Amylostereum chailletii]|nr:hypothetical protein OF83DRAFT_86841 [Amylostereum chailletii]
MSRRPLVDLPLDQFLPSDINATQSSATFSGRRTSHKRPLSPGPTHTFVSPVKRRILEQDTLFSPKTRSPLSGLSSDARSSTRPFPIQVHPSRGLDGLAKKLDFGSPKENAAVFPGVQTSGGATVTTRHSTPTPTRRTRSSSRLPSPPAHLSTPSKRAPKSSTKATASLAREASLSPVMIQRELPLTFDPTSAHYPGFDVHWDSHIVIPRAHSCIPPSSMERDCEAEKENLRPRRSSRKSEGSLKKKYPDEPSVALRRSPRLNVGDGQDEHGSSRKEKTMEFIAMEE